MNKKSEADGTRRGSGQPPRKRLQRKLLLPAEHGSWSWLLVPYLVGVLVVREFNLPALLVLLGGLAAFLMRQPATYWLRVRQGRARRSEGPLARDWTLGLGAVALLCFGLLLAMGRLALLWLAPPLLLILGLYLAAALSRGRSVRTLWMELAGAIGLAAMAPAAYIAARGTPEAIAFILWALMGAQNGLGALYVRVRIADLHGRSTRRRPMAWAHAVVFLVILSAIAVEWLPWLVALPFAAFLARAFWAAWTVRPLENVKRFGFTEVGVELVSGLIIAAAFLLLA